MSLFQVAELLFFPDNWIVGYVLILVSISLLFHLPNGSKYLRNFPHCPSLLQVNYIPKMKHPVYPLLYIYILYKWINYIWMGVEWDIFGDVLIAIVTTIWSMYRWFMMIYDDLWWFMMIYDDLWCFTWWLIPLSKWLITPIISGLTRSLSHL